METGMLPHVSPALHFVIREEQAILMDLARNRYFSFSEASAIIWAGLAARLDIGQIVERLVSQYRVSSLTAHELVLRQLELWSELGFCGPEQTRTHAELLPHSKTPGTPADVGIDERRVGDQELSVASIVRVIAASWWLRRVLMRSDLGLVIHAIQQTPPKVRAADDWDRILYLTLRAYFAMRRLHRRESDCLTRTLVLALTLRRQGVTVDICFGVKTLPFLAHAWVEAAGVVLNDAPESIRNFTVLARF